MQASPASRSTLLSVELLVLLLLFVVGVIVAYVVTQGSPPVAPLPPHG